jgi:quinol monooxygenase YgiN
MVTEIAEFTARPGKADELQAGLTRAMDVIRRGEGCRGIILRHCIEEPDRFVYEITWETLQHHTVAFRQGPLFAEYRGHINGLFVEPVVVHHYNTLATAEV